MSSQSCQSSGFNISQSRHAFIESSYFFYEHEFKEILFILDNSGARAVASGHQRTRRPTRSTCELILWIYYYFDETILFELML